MQRVRNNIRKARKHIQKTRRDIRKRMERMCLEERNIHFEDLPLATRSAIDEAEIFSAVHDLLQDDTSLDDIEVYDDNGNKVTSTSTLQAIREARKIAAARRIMRMIARHDREYNAS